MANINVRRDQSEDREPDRREARSVARREQDPWHALQTSDLFTSNPFSLMRRMHDEMDRMLAEAFGGGWGQNVGQRVGGGMMSRWAPPIEVSEHEGNLVICADLPGINKDDVRVEVTDDALVIAGERKHESEQTRAGLRQTERSYGSFQRVIPLPDGAKADAAKARFHDGVLEIRIPMDEQRSKSRRIQIDTGEGGRAAGSAQKGRGSAAGNEAGEQGRLYTLRVSESRAFGVPNMRPERPLQRRPPPVQTAFPGDESPNLQPVARVPHKRRPNLSSTAL